MMVPGKIYKHNNRIIEVAPDCAENRKRCKSEGLVLVSHPDSESNFGIKVGSPVTEVSRIATNSECPCCQAEIEGASPSAGEWTHYCGSCYWLGKVA
jgi:hypothetical protein